MSRRRQSSIGKAIAVSGLWLTLAQTLLGQSLQYDAYYVLPGAAGVGGVDVVVSGRDVGDLAGASSLDLSAKYSITEKVEVGALMRSGVLDKNLGPVSALTVGAKYGFSTEVSAATVNLAVPVGDVEELGVSMGYMYTKALGGLSINSMLLFGWLKAYSGGSGVSICVPTTAKYRLSPCEQDTIPVACKRPWITEGPVPTTRESKAEAEPGWVM